MEQTLYPAHLKGHIWAIRKEEVYWRNASVYTAVQFIKADKGQKECNCESFFKGGTFQKPILSFTFFKRNIAIGVLPFDIELFGNYNSNKTCNTTYKLNWLILNSLSANATERDFFIYKYLHTWKL